MSLVATDQLERHHPQVHHRTSDPSHEGSLEDVPQFAENTATMPAPLASFPHEFELVREEARQLLVTAFDYANEAHAALVRRLFVALFPRGRLGSELISTEWKNVGFQRSNPAPDFRASGLFGLRMLIFFAESYPEALRLIIETHRPREPWHYPVAVAGITIASLIADVLQLRIDPDLVVRTPILLELAQWLRSLDDVGEMFCAMFTHLEDRWHEHKATYMTFQQELALLRARLERAVPRPRDAEARTVAFNRHMFEERLNDDSLVPESHAGRGASHCTVS